MSNIISWHVRVTAKQCWLCSMYESIRTVLSGVPITRNFQAMPACKLPHKTYVLSVLRIAVHSSLRLQQQRVYKLPHPILIGCCTWCQFQAYWHPAAFTTPLRNAALRGFNHKASKNSSRATHDYCPLSDGVFWRRWTDSDVLKLVHQANLCNFATAKVHSLRRSWNMPTKHVLKYLFRDIVHHQLPHSLFENFRYRFRTGIHCYVLPIQRECSSVISINLSIAASCRPCKCILFLTTARLKRLKTN